MADVEHSRARRGTGPKPAGVPGAPGLVPSRIGAVRACLWLVAAALAVRQLVAVQLLPPGERLTELETWIGPDGVLKLQHSLYATGEFPGTPFAGLVLRPLTRAAENALGLAWTFGTLLLVALLGIVAARALPQPVSRRTTLLAPPVAICLLMLSLPVRNTLYLGQTSVLPVLLVLLGCCTVGAARAGTARAGTAGSGTVRNDALRAERLAGLLVGLAAALEPTLLLFAVLLWALGRRTTAVSAGAAFAVCTLAAWAAMPADSLTYWLHHPTGLGLGAPADSLGNQSLHGALLRLGLTGAWEAVAYGVLAAAVLALALPRAVRFARDGQLLLAVALTGCAAVAVSPTSWQHQLLWVLLAVVGRTGRRAAGRAVWPAVVVMVLTLPPAMLVPNKAALYPLRDNAVLLAVLAAACVVPFLSRTAPHFAAPEPTPYAAPGASRFGRIPLLPFWRRARTRPPLLLELLMIRVGYAGYDYVRIAADGGRATAERHGRELLDVERALHMDIEHWANHAAAGIGWLRGFCDFYYESFHFVVPLAIFAVLYVRRPVDFRWARTSLGFATLVALVGFWLFPLAPPRLMPGLGIIDTVHGVQDFSKPDYGVLTAVTNQYAAMPSLHFGWSLWCGVVIVLLARRRWQKALGALHPLCTVTAIVATGNHWVLDAVGGAAVVGTGFALTWLLAGPRADPAEAEAVRADGSGDAAVSGGHAAVPGPPTAVTPAPEAPAAGGSVPEAVVPSVPSVPKQSAPELPVPPPP